MNFAVLATLVLCGIFAKHVTSNDPLIATIKVLNDINAPALLKAANAPFSQAAFQNSTRALATLVQVLQALTLPYLGQKLGTLDGSVATLANMVGVFNSSLEGMNIALSEEIDTQEAHNTEKFEELNEQVTALNTEVSLFGQNLTFLRIESEEGNQALHDRIDELNNTTSKLPIDVLEEKVDEVIEELGINHAVEALSDRIDELSEDFDEAKEEGDEKVAYAIVQAQEEADDLYEMILDLHKTVDDHSEALYFVSDEISAVYGEIDSVNEEVGEVKSDVEDVEGEVDDLKQEVADLHGYIDDNIIDTAIAVAEECDAKIQGLGSAVEQELINVNEIIRNNNENLNDALESTNDYLETLIIESNSALAEELDQKAEDMGTSVSTGFKVIQDQIDDLFANDLITVYTDNTKVNAPHKTFRINIPIDKDGVKVSSDEWHYSVPLDNLNFANPPNVQVTAVYKGAATAQQVSLTLSQISSSLVVVQVKTHGGNDLDTSGDLSFNLFAFGN